MTEHGRRVRDISRTRRRRPSRRRALPAMLAPLLLLGLVGLVAVPAADVAASGALSGHRSLEGALRTQTANGLVIERNGVGGAVSFLGGARALTPPDDGDPGDVAREFVDEYGPLFGADGAGSSLADDGSIDTADGGAAVRFQQEVDAVPVLAGQLVVRVAGDGSVRSTAGEALSDTDIDTTATVPAADAAALAIAVTVRNEEVDAELLSASTPALWIYDPELIGAGGPPGPRLVWRMDVRTALGDIDRLVLVDAHSGTVALTFSQVHAADSQVCDNNNVVRASYAQGVCPSATQTIVRSDSVNLSANAEVQSAYALSEAVQAFYLGLGRNSIDDAGMAVVSTVRFCISGSACPFANAFWSGQQMVYGATYASGDDVVGHELTHGVTQYESQLLYYAESGAINESLSDVFGELFDQSYNPPSGAGNDTGDQRWRMGEDLPIGAIRDMADPTVFNDPDRMTSALYWNSADDEYGVHINSGVNNKAAFLIADGGTFNGQTITGLGNTKTAAIYYEAQTSLLTSGSDYRDLFDALRQACSNMIGQFGIVAADCTSVGQAVVATEMNLAPTVAGGRLTASDCPVGQRLQSTLYANDMEAQSGWTFSPSSPASSAWQYWNESSQSGSSSMFAPDPDIASQSTTTMTATVNISSANTYVKFEHSFSFDTSGNYPSLAYWDGGIVRYSANGGGFTNITGIAGLAAVNGYNGTLRTTGQGNTNALQGQTAFVGNSPGYQETRYNIGALNGQTFALQFLLGTDSSVGYPGWAIDDVKIYTCVAASNVVPEPPTGVVATPGTGSVFLSWLPPENDGGSPITSYTVQPFAGATPLTPIVTGSNSAGRLVTGLSAGVAYSFKVAATNVVGTGTSSSASSTVVLGTAPGAPTGVVATVGDRSAALTWTAPASDGGAAITTYLVTPILGGVAQAPITTGSTTTSFTVTSLTNGASYSFAVAAQNTIGVGAASVASNTVVPSPDGFIAVQPARVFDTRPGQSPEALRTVPKVPVVPSTPLDVDMSSLPDRTPATGIGAVSINVAVTNPAAAGFVTVYSCGARKLVASVNYVAGQTVSNAVIAPASPSGHVCFFSSAPADVIVDINGWFPSGTGYTAVGPERVFDTRPGESPDALRVVPKAQVTTGTILDVVVFGLPGGVTPASGVGAVSLNVAVTNPLAAGFITVFPCLNRKLVASVNFVAGQTVSNAVIAPVSADGHVCFFTSAPTDLVVDINGWFPSGDSFTAVGPERVLDTRPGESPGALRSVQKLQVTPDVPLQVQVINLPGAVTPASGVGAVSLNVAVTNPAAAGFVTVYPCPTRPFVASVNYVRAQTVSNAVIAPVSADGFVCFFSSVATDIIVDINGWFPS